MAACAGTAPSRLGYAPPADQPTQPGAGYVGRASADLIWDQLLDRLNQSELQVDLADRQRGVMVATYSGDPTPYVNCGSILLYDGGEPEQIDGLKRSSASSAACCPRSSRAEGCCAGSGSAISVCTIVARRVTAGRAQVSTCRCPG